MTAIEFVLLNNVQVLIDYRNLVVLRAEAMVVEALVVIEAEATMLNHLTRMATD